MLPHAVGKNKSDSTVALFLLFKPCALKKVKVLVTQSCLTLRSSQDAVIIPFSFSAHSSPVDPILSTNSLHQSFSDTLTI